MHIPQPNTPKRKDHALNWNELNAFVEVARSGSLAAAAAALDASAPTVRRRIDLIESRCGFALFERGREGLQLTSAGGRLFTAASAMANGPVRARRAVDSPAATVVIAAGEILGPLILTSILLDLNRSHPELLVEMLTLPGSERIAQAGADIYVAPFPPEARKAAARRIGAVEMGLYAHRRRVAADGPLETLADVPRFRIIAGESEADNRYWLNRLGLPFTPDDVSFRSDSPIGQFSAVMAGVGIGLCMVAQARREEELIRVLPEVSTTLDVWAWISVAEAPASRVMRVFDALEAALAAASG